MTIDVNVLIIVLIAVVIVVMISRKFSPPIITPPGLPMWKIFLANIHPIFKIKIKALPDDIRKEILNERDSGKFNGFTLGNVFNDVSDHNFRTYSRVRFYFWEGMLSVQEGSDFIEYPITDKEKLEILAILLKLEK